jgi:hypothetical protein
LIRYLAQSINSGSKLSDGFIRNSINRFIIRILDLDRVIVDEVSA